MRWTLLAALAACTPGMIAGDDEPPPPPQPGFTAQNFDRYRVLDRSEVEAAIDHRFDDVDRFSARFTATLTVPVDGTYTFATTADDGVRLWIDDQLVIDNWIPHFVERHEGAIDLTAGTAALRLEYFELDLDAELHLAWIPPGGSETLLDSTHVMTASPIDGAPKPPYANPVVPFDCPDPGVIGVGDAFYAICTGGAFPIRRSYDLVMWEDTGAVVFPDGKPAWAANGFRNWAPEMHEVDGAYVVYYTTVNGNDVLSIGAARADSPTGPFVDRGGPLVEHPQGVIDATYVRAAGTHYLAYKIDGNSVGAPTPIFIRELAPDGLSFTGEAIEILRNDPGTWEGGVVEAPWIIERDGTYFLFYSGNVYDERYRTGVARASSVTGPYEKLGAPILANNGTWAGPGHGSVIAINARDYFVYHAWHAGDPSQGRNILVDEIAYVDGWPVIGDGTPSTGLRPWPGEAE